MPEKDAMLSLAKEEGEEFKEGGRVGSGRGIGGTGRKRGRGRGYTEQLRLQTVLKTVSAH